MRFSAQGSSRIGYTQRAGLTALPSILPSTDYFFASMHTHFLDTPKRSEISALLKPLPISSTTCDSRRLNNIGRSSLTAFRLLRFLFIGRKSILPETV